MPVLWNVKGDVLSTFPASTWTNFWPRRCGQRLVEYVVVIVGVVVVLVVVAVVVAGDIGGSHKSNS